MARRRGARGAGAGCLGTCCRVEAVVAVDERGQMVLPKELRERAGIRPGDKLAVVAWQKGHRVCCLALVRAEAMAGLVGEILGPLVKDIVRR